MATLTVQQIVIGGLEPAAEEAAAALGDVFPNNGRTYLKVTDTGTTAPVVTITSQVACNQGETHTYTVTVQSGEYRLIGPFPPNQFNNSSGQVEITYSSETDVTVTAFSL